MVQSLTVEISNKISQNDIFATTEHGTEVKPAICKHIKRHENNTSWKKVYLRHGIYILSNSLIFFGPKVNAMTCSKTSQIESGLFDLFSLSDPCFVNSYLIPWLNFFLKFVLILILS